MLEKQVLEGKYNGFIYNVHLFICGLPSWLRVQNLPAMQETCPWVGKIHWRRQWQPTLVFLPKEFHGQRRLAGYSPWGRKESETTK